jgi:hypothetical protein
MRAFTQIQNQPQKPVSDILAGTTTAASVPNHDRHAIPTRRQTFGGPATQSLSQDNPESLAVKSSKNMAGDAGHDFSRIPVSGKARLLIQPKLKISTPGDAGEQEADRVAEQVMRMPSELTSPTPGRPGETGGAPALQRACNCGSQSVTGTDEELQRWPMPSFSAVAGNVLSRVAGMRDMGDSEPPKGIPGDVEEKDEEAGQTNAVKRKAAGGAAPQTIAPANGRPNFGNALDAASHGGGQPLPTHTRQFMEPRFGHDFSAVRIHADNTAGELAQQVQARAFTTGSRIFFASGEFQPNQTGGKQLLAHELAHVVQQSKGGSGLARQIQRKGNGGLNCPPYASYDKSMDLKKYNCAGLAHRSYDFRSLAATKAFLASNTSSVACGTSCKSVGMVKQWLWEYDVHYQDSHGTTAQDPPTDFHTVGGPTDGDPVAKESDEFFTKNGKRPVYGPGTAPSFKPPAREQATLSDPSEKPQFDDQGKPIYKLRSNFKETCYCMPCPKAPAGP